MSKPKGLVYQHLYNLRLRDGDNCAVCGLRNLFYYRPPKPLQGLKVSIDHIIPVCQGGTDNLSNLRLTHYWCNTSRHNYTPRQCRRRVYRWWRQHLGLRTLDGGIITHFKKFPHQYFKDHEYTDANLVQGHYLNPIQIRRRKKVIANMTASLRRAIYYKRLRGIELGLIKEPIAL